MTVICNGSLQISKRQSNKLTNKTKTKQRTKKSILSCQFLFLCFSYETVTLALACWYFRNRTLATKKRRVLRKTLKKNCFFSLSVSVHLLTSYSMITNANFKLTTCLTVNVIKHYIISLKSLQKHLLQLTHLKITS